MRDRERLPLRHLVRTFKHVVSSHDNLGERKKKFFFNYCVLGIYVDSGVGALTLVLCRGWAAADTGDRGVCALDYGGARTGVLILLQQQRDSTTTTILLERFFVPYSSFFFRVQSLGFFLLRCASFIVLERIPSSFIRDTFEGLFFSYELSSWDD